MPAVRVPVSDGKTPNDDALRLVLPRRIGVVPPRVAARAGCPHLHGPSTTVKSQCPPISVKIQGNLPSGSKESSRGREIPRGPETTPRSGLAGVASKGRGFHQGPRGSPWGHNHRNHSHSVWYHERVLVNEMPLGFLRKAARSVFLRSTIGRILNFRRNRIQQIFAPVREAPGGC